MFATIAVNHATETMFRFLHHDSNPKIPKTRYKKDKRKHHVKLGNIKQNKEIVLL